MSITYARHLDRIEKIKQNENVQTVIELWECKFNKMIVEDQEFKEFHDKEKDIRPPINPRNALSGGRTNAILLHHVGSIGYVDFTSLYPYIQKYGIFPIGHPEVITENFQSVDSYFGLIFCRILPPKNLYIPILPFHVNNKLVFPLCATCAKQQEQDTCKHSDYDRELEGTWVSLEINEAVKNGYIVTKVFEVWNFERKEQYDPVHESGGLFTNYVNTFLKIKQESSGYPRWVLTESDKNKYIDEYYKHEGILLEKKNICVNNGLKAISKLLLNSQWGRYAMQTNKTKCKFLTNAYEMFNYLYNDQYEVVDVVFATDNVGLLYYKDLKEMHWGSNQTNVVIAAFVTSQARLKLYSELKKLGERVIYFDTDSVFYKKSKNAFEYEPLCGDYLGMFTDEIDPSEGTEIVEFASAGPKNYTFKMNTGITHTKVKGFSLNHTASQKIDFEKIKNMVFQHKEPNQERVIQNTITRNKKDWTVATKQCEKIYRLVYDKRVILNDLSTIPYGYVK